MRFSIHEEEIMGNVDVPTLVKCISALFKQNQFNMIEIVSPFRFLHALWYLEQRKLLVGVHLLLKIIPLLLQHIFEMSLPQLLIAVIVTIFVFKCILYMWNE